MADPLPKHYQFLNIDGQITNQVKLWGIKRIFLSNLLVLIDCLSNCSNK
jgi:hypothetical protein